MATQIAEPRHGLLRTMRPTNIRCREANRYLAAIQSLLGPQRLLRFNLGCWLTFILSLSLALNSFAVRAYTQEIWEYSPYRVQIWLSIDPALAISPQATGRLEHDLTNQLDLVFGPTWNTKIDAAPAWLRYSIIHDLDRLQPSVLASGDYIMIVGKKNPTTDGIRSLDSFVDKGLDVLVHRKHYENTVERLAPDPTATSFTRLKDALKSEAKTSFQLVESIAKDEIPAALVSKSDMQIKADDLRLITSIGDYALVVPRKNAKTKEIDSLDAFNELKLPVATPQDKFEMLSKRLREDSITRLKSLLRPTDKTTAQLAAEVASGQLTAAIVMKDDFALQAENTRSIVVRFSNQSDAFLDRHDKLYFAGLKMSSRGPVLQVRELDCPTRRLSNVYERELYHPTQFLAAPIAGLIRDCFTPLARIEESSPTTVRMRGRAAGLVTADTHPVLLQPGDVLQAVVRRNDRNGQPSLLETVPWTFIVATDVQGEYIDGFVFSGIRGGLEGRRNSRTQRLAMLVKPQGSTTDLQVVTQNAKDKPLAATQIFERLPGGDRSNPIGRTDWRGILRLPNPQETPIATFRLPKAKTLSEPSDSTATTPPAEPSPKQETAEEEEARTLKLRAPLMIYYVKNGETLLARLPVVIGLSPTVTAEVPDDSRRLQAEGFLRGLQSEVVDVVAARQVAAARVRMRIEERKFADADQMLEELRRIKDYEKMARELDDVQRKILDPAGGAIAPVAQMRIEKMFQQTRELLQKYLQNDLVKKVERELEAAKKGGEAPADNAPASLTPSSTTAGQGANTQPAAPKGTAPQNTAPQNTAPQATAPLSPTPTSPPSESPKALPNSGGINSGGPGTSATAPLAPEAGPPSLNAPIEGPNSGGTPPMRKASPPADGNPSTAGG